MVCVNRNCGGVRGFSAGFNRVASKLQGELLEWWGFVEIIMCTFPAAYNTAWCDWLDGRVCHQPWWDFDSHWPAFAVCVCWLGLEALEKAYLVPLMVLACRPLNANDLPNLRQIWSWL
jgi:hypothetical protein